MKLLLPKSGVTISSLTTPTKIVIAVIAGVAALLVLAVGVSAAMMPGCGWCHGRGAFETQTARGAHSSVACRDCHGGTSVQSRLAFGVDQVFGMTLGVMTVDPSTAKTSSKQCLACHDDLAGTQSSAGLRIRHKECTVGRECVDCHSATAHGRAVRWPTTTTMDMCYDCHGKGGVPAECDTCHTAKLPSERIKTGTFRVTHGPNAKKTHGMGDMRTCAQCHGEDKCAKCHGVGLPHPDDFVARHGQMSALPTAQCTECHEKSFCTDCHQYDMPHPRSFIKVHAKRTQIDGEPTCKRCHADEDCVQCHVDHVHPTTEQQMDKLRNTPARGSTQPPGGE